MSERQYSSHGLVWYEPFRRQLLEEVLAGGNVLFLHSGFIWDSSLVSSIEYSLFLTSSDSLQGSQCPAMEYPSATLWNEADIPGRDATNPS